MKKYFLTLVLGLFAVVGFAQVTLDGHAGLTVSNLIGTENGFNPNAKPGFVVGVGVDYAFTDKVSFKSGLDVVSQGAKSKEDGLKAKINPIYLEVPLMGAYKFNLNENVKLVGMAGLFMGVGVGGKFKVEVDNVSVDYKLFSKDDDLADEALMNRFNMGVKYGIGLEVNDRYLINLIGQNSFTNAFNGDFDLDGKLMNFAISVGYKF